MAAIMAARRYDDLDPAFDGPPSLAASLEDFEEHERRSPMFEIPSQHSGFRSEQDEKSEADDRSSSGAPWSPPGFRTKARASNASSWFRHDPYSRHRLQPSLSPSRSRQTSPEYQDAEEDPDITLAANIPLPPGTDSPYKDRSPEPEDIPDNIMKDFDESTTKPENANNYIRFAVRAEVQHREPFVPLINFFRRKIDSMTQTRSSTLFSIFVSILALAMVRVVLMPPVPSPVPDLVKLSTLAKSFEPLIFYSENGHSQITALQETSVAVWDLGESVRYANIESAPQISKGLDELSDSLRTLSDQMTRFFAAVDADIDGILIVMDWAKRELTGVSKPAGAALTGTVFDHLHGLLNRGGILETRDGPTSLGKVLTSVFGVSTPQRTRAMLTRTFHEFLNVLEESISNELTHSTALFTLFNSIDGQFLNIQRVVVRETDTQEQLEGELLSSLWTRVMGSNSARLRKFEKNKSLLQDVRARTVNNKHLIVDHHRRLQTLKASLETLRQKLVSPLVRRNDSVSIDNASIIEDQIRGLEGTHDYLQGVRDAQKHKVLEMIYGAGARNTRIMAEPKALGIEER